MMNDNTDLIKEQFNKQSTTFGRMMGHYEALDLIVKLSHVTEKDTVLDVACGPGIVGCAFAKKVLHVHGIDLVGAMIERAQEYQRSQGLTNMTWEIGTVNPLPYPHCNYTIAVSRFAFHHFPDPLAVLHEMTRVVAWEGKVVVVDVFTTSQVQADLYDSLEKLRDPSHTHALNLSELQRMFKEAGLNVVEEHIYHMEVDVEELLIATLTPSHEAEMFKDIVKKDVGINNIGINAFIKEDKLKFLFPIVIMVGVKQIPENYGLSCCA